MGHRLLYTFVVFVVWCALFVSLHQRVVAERVLELVPRLSDDGDRVLRDEWLVLSVQNRPVGHLRVSLAEAVDEDRGGRCYVQTSRAAMRVETMGVRQQLRTECRTVTDSDLSLRRFHYHLDSNLHRMLVQGARVREGLQVRTSSMGTAVTETLPFDTARPLYLPDTVRLVLLRAGLTQGATWELPVFDPATLAVAPTRVRVLGREAVPHEGRAQMCWKLEQTRLGLASTLWMTDRGEVLREESHTGLLHLAARAASADEALAAAQRGAIAAEDLLVTTRVQAKGVLTEPRQVGFLQVRITGVDWRAFPAHGGRIVRNAGDGVVLELDRLPRYQPADERDLRTTLSMPVSDPAIQAKARELTAGEPQAQERARRLADWVHRNIRKVPRVTFPQAAEVLATQSGDCNEHAVLFGALCRAVGVPCRVVAGVVALDDAYFYYHAWNEVCPDGQHWIAVDTTFGQWPADATHLKLVEGELGEQTALLQAIGRLRIEILSAKRAA